jgi:hypothetical protein
VHSTLIHGAGAAAIAASLALTASAQHAGDMALVIVDGAITTNALEGASSTPERVFAATFGDTGVARFTSNPGFEALPGTFAAGSRVGFTPRAGLRRFLDGGLSPVVAEELEIKFLTLASVVGSDFTAGFDLAVQSNGGWHRHLNFTLRAAGGKLPPTGIYVAELELYSNDGVTLPSAPFWIVFNDGASVAEHDAALAWVAANLADGGTPCAADLDADGGVGASDLATLLSAWGSPGADLTADGDTNAADLAVLLSAWGACR